MHFEELYQAIRLRFGDVNASQSMGEWICANTTLKSKPFSFEQYAFQKAIADDMHPNMAVKKCSQIGLALSLDTPLPTPAGWTTMGDVEIGDQVIDEKGRPTTVTFKSEVYIDHTCYDVEFDDGSVLTADKNHRWFVQTSRGPFNEDGVFTGQGRPKKSEGYAHEGVVSTQFLVDNFDKAKFYIPVAQPLALPKVELPMDPYIYGLWLGDGTRYSASLTVGDRDIAQITKLLAERGTTLVPSSELQYRLLDQYKNLRLMGVLGQPKTIPIIFQRASRSQRLELLRGLMDSDGSITEKGRASFHNTEQSLVEAVQELLSGLGFKHRTRWRKPNGSGYGGKKPIAEIGFVPKDERVFNLDRKAERQQTRTSRPRFTENRTITKITQVPPVPVQCLTVDSPSHLFLAGVTMIPTHNTEVQIRKYLAILTRSTALSGIFSFPNENMRDRTYNARIKTILENDDVFNPPTVNKPTRSKSQVQIRDSFGFITGATESDATNTSADFLFHDEVDLSDQEVLSLYQSRLQGSDMQMTQAFSTPTFSGFGISRSYDLTDQREYFIQCNSCRHHQIPRFEPKFVHVQDFPFDVEAFTELTSEQISLLNLEDCHVKCEKCSARLDLGNPDLREWVPTFPSRTNARGYQVRPFSTSRIKPGYIFGQLSQYQRNSFTRGFYNTVLGEDYSSADARLQQADLDVAFSKGTPRIPEVSLDTPCFIGIDVGFTCHITVSFDDPDGNPHVALFDTVPSAFLQDRVKELMKIYNIVQGAIDRFPYTELANSIRDATGGRIIPVQYRGTSLLQPVNEPDTKVLSHYSANNTFLFDRLQAVVGHKKIGFSGYQGQRETIESHMKDMVRNEKPGESVQAEWMKTSGEDHYFHSLALNLLCRRISEHMFATQMSTITTSPSFVGGKFANTGGSLGFNQRGDANLKRISGFR